ncbi:L-type lectin-domain containing receptor kinase SIT2-like [Amaranthus tricolor]|uniref:L-type lectin-domain containing receptor kinase SIT2-like n=1 Tax=Amaranthus tricolor TaxID=29722 RepID=UPI002584A62D|nr:L-type lectin-domain containing receptor kinase SIT2-like [Amaranthus tricolor]
MGFKITLNFIVIYFWSLTPTIILAQNSNQFIYQNFQGAKLHIDGAATLHSNGLLQLTNYTKQLTAHVFHPTPLNFSSSSSYSFSTTFVFAMYPEIQTISGHGIVFILSPSMEFPSGVPGKFFGIFNSAADFKPSDNIFAVELDTIQDFEFNDIDSNHVGINVNSLISNVSASASYYSDVDKQNKSLNLTSAKPMQIWIDYNDKTMVFNVTLAPLGILKPSRPLLSHHVNLSGIVRKTMYVGFTSSTGSVASSHYLLGWSFAHGGNVMPTLDLSNLPKLPRYGNGRKLSVGSMILLIVISVIVVTIGLVYYMIRRKKFEEVVEDWEQEYLLQRFSYKDLYNATKGFKDKELLGVGGFGKVYRGVLKSPKLEVAVKKVSHGSGQGMKEFVAEVACMGRLRHRNLVQLLGYCRRKCELLLVYDYMPNGSLDKYLYEEDKPNLSWNARFKVIRGVASALVYLHEEWEQVVVHRDVKASNVMLDADMNARLGDFGLARLYDHGTNPQTTHVVGTVGYLAPELTRKGKATISTDVFSFGVFILEVACGKSPITALQGSSREMYLIDWVYECWKKGMILEACDPKLGGAYVVEEIELVLKLGMLCCNPKPEGRPNMRQVMQFLNGDNPLPEMTPFDAKAAQANLGSFPISSAGNSACASYSNDSILQVGR